MDVETLPTEAETPLQAPIQVARSTKLSKPPAIILHSKISNHGFFKTLDAHVTKGYHVKNSKNNTNLYINDRKEYEKCMEVLEKEDISFHSYTLKEEKPHSFVIKGIDSEPATEDIQNDLETKHNLKVKNVFKLKTKGRGVYMVQTDNTIYLKYLINNVRYVCHTKIQWERYKNQDPWVQCRRCQRLGHSTSNCRAEPRCVKCGENHWSKICIKVFKDKVDTHINIKCANCDGTHVAFSKECPIIKNRIKIAEQMKNKLQDKSNFNKSFRPNKTNYVMAPPPQVNAWTNRNINNGQQAVADQGYTQTTASNDLSGLVREFNVLNNLIDLSKMLNLVRELNKVLANCKDDLEKFEKLNEFCQTNFKANKFSSSASP